MIKLSKTSFFIAITILIIGLFVFSSFTSLAQNCYKSPYSYEQWMAKEDTLSGQVAQLKNYANCQIPCEAAQTEASSFWEKYGAPPIECGGNSPCCWKSSEKKNPDCTAQLQALDAKKNQLCSLCNLPAGLKDPVDGRTPWQSTNITLEAYIQSQENYLNQTVIPAVDELATACGAQTQQPAKVQQPAQTQTKTQAETQKAESQGSGDPAKVSGKTPAKNELKQKISQTENLEDKLNWENGKEEAEEPKEKIGKGKKAYMFIQPELTTFEAFSLSGEMNKWEQKFKDMGYEVVKVHWDQISVKQAFSDPNIGAIDYYGHNGLDTSGSWLSKRIFKLFNRTPAIYGHDADSIKNLIYEAKYEQYVKTMSQEEAHRRAWAEKDNLGLDIANVHACYSADNDSLRNVFIKEGGVFRGEEGPYHGFDTLDVSM